MPYPIFKNKWKLLLLLLSLPAAAIAQPVPVLLRNASFEDEPAISQPPREWYYCGPPEETPPDVQPNGVFGETQSPYHGHTYLAMVVRDNNTWESVGQRLLEPLKAGKCYEFSIFLACPVIYQSVSRASGLLDNYIRPVNLRIWGGGSHCDRRDLLAVSPPVKSTDWTKHTFRIKPKEDVYNLLLEACFLPDNKPYNGGLLLDAASPILEMDCETLEKLVTVKKIDFQQPAQIADLERLIALQIQQLEMDSTGQQLAINYFIGPDGIYRQANIPLWIIARTLSAFPAWQLVISVPENPAWSARELVAEINRQFDDAGLPKHQRTIRVATKRDKRRDWSMRALNDMVWAVLK